MTKKANKMQDMLNQFIANWKRHDATGDVVRRRQTEESIREVAPRALAKKIIKELRESK